MSEEEFKTIAHLSTIQNNIKALDAKLNNFIDIANKSNVTQEKVNEILNLIHNLGFERDKSNKNMFDCIFPDVVHRINELEKKQGKFGQPTYKPGDHFDIVYGKGKKQNRVHVYVTSDGFNFHMGDRTLGYKLDCPTYPIDAKLKKNL